MILFILVLITILLICVAYCQGRVDSLKWASKRIEEIEKEE